MTIRKARAATYRGVAGDESHAVPTATAIAIDDVGHGTTVDDHGGETPLAVAAPVAVAPQYAEASVSPAVVPAQQPPQQFAMTAIDSPTMPAYFKVQAPVAPPQSMSVFRAGDDDALVIKRRWYNRGVYFKAAFAIFWNGFMLVWNSFAIVSGAYVFAIFGLLHDAVGLFLIYDVVTTFVNSTFVTVRDGSITVENRPIRRCCEAPKEVDTMPIREIRCKRNVNVGSDGSVDTSFDVRAVDVNRIETVIVGGLALLEEALFLEQELENYLGLGQATVVSGEVA
mmetsp:Transcript_3331/g.5824  ORF Transcript_3331/g.5824 Transcript_3331/m.5824 type:complete len:283 (-) Transcript_3331:185-1033(-)|eukprot:CAMPEP_0197464180 /NCGR_PEP_ID=MMETSP1175-20131217/63807_1 /TAXON_ID=1003142 /ORGANISM="Triceratium dubium, Strain CCMP147" /LENGTH=282 /DNA_ID=CAMNT_0043000129 /DNA_START=95 /DNA_END=943 /DNA_ORIENTATION=+